MPNKKENRKMKCLVTGGMGFIGSHLARKLESDGHDVLVIDNKSEGFPRPTSSKIMLVDIRADLNKLFEQERFDWVFHLAAIPLVQQSIAQPEETHDVNVNGTFNLLMMSKKYTVKRFVFSSSSSVYGDQDRLPHVETMTPNPLSPYALHKLMGEQYAQMFNNLWDLSAICLRYFNVFGPGMNPNGAYANLLPKFIKLMKTDQQPTINGDGQQTRDFTFVEDVVRANILAAQSNFVGAVNIGSGKNRTVNEIAQTLNRKLGKNIEPIHGPTVVESRSTLADISKAKETLDWEPRVTFEEGLERMINET